MADPSSSLYSRYSPYLETYVELRIADGVVHAVRFPSEAAPDAAAEHPLLDRIDDYLSGTVRDEFDDVEVALPGEPLARTVLEAVREIPYGENATVADLARTLPEIRVDDGKDLERVRQILHDNPVPLIVPDHRVRDGPSGAPPKVEQRLRSLEKIAT